ncbi:uncharacterized protein V6R79_008291 [Siganus canaliculatus]
MATEAQADKLISTVTIAQADKLITMSCSSVEQTLTHGTLGQNAKTRSTKAPSAGHAPAADSRKTHSRGRLEKAWPVVAKERVLCAGRRAALQYLHKQP